MWWRTWTDGTRQGREEDKTRGMNGAERKMKTGGLLLKKGTLGFIWRGGAAQIWRFFTGSAPGYIKNTALFQPVYSRTSENDKKRRKCYLWENIPYSLLKSSEVIKQHDKQNEEKNVRWNIRRSHKPLHFLSCVLSLAWQFIYLETHIFIPFIFTFVSQARKNDLYVCECKDRQRKERSWNNLLLWVICH